MAVLSSLVAESGLPTVLASSRDVHLLLLSRMVRFIAYGQSTLVLTHHLSVGLGWSDVRMGTFMTLTLIGDVAGSWVLTAYADRWGRRKVLRVGCGLMVLSGAVFARASGFGWLLGAAVVGVISPSGNEIGPFKAVEESTLAQLVVASDRATIFAWYNLVGGLASACGSLTAGWLTAWLAARSKAPGSLDGDRVVFVFYMVWAGIKLFLTLLLSDECEVRSKPIMSEIEEHALLPMNAGSSDDPELEAREDGKQGGMARNPGLVAARSAQHSGSVPLPTFSQETRGKLVILSGLFGVDNLASGLIPLSFVIYFFSTKFELDPGTLGTTFFTTSAIAAVSSLFAASLSRRIGNIKTMAFTHLPSSLFLVFLPFPSTFVTAKTLLILRFCTSTMDGAPRSAFIASYVPAHERTAVMGTLNVVKTVSQSFGPMLTGWLAGQGAIWISFVVAGCLKISYDLGILYFFTKAQMMS